MSAPRGSAWQVPQLSAELRERLGLSPDAFDALVDAFIETVPARPADAAFLERALGYPWERPDGSFVLDGDAVLPARTMTSARRDALRAAPRVPLLAIGSNGSPSALRRKFAALAGADRQILVETGEVAHLDIGALATPTVYGSFPATPIESHGTHVRAAMLWPTAAQLEALTWSELSYWVGQLHGHPFTADDGAGQVDGYLIYVARWGAIRLDGGVVALQAVAARGRVARAVTQSELLDAAARRLLGADADGVALLKRLATDHAATRRALAPLLRPDAVPFSPPGWRALTS